MQSEDTARIPLRARDGSVRAYALIDASDAEWANQWYWSLNRYYAARLGGPTGKRRVIYLHRELLGLTHGDGIEGDHINRDKLDCRRSNLRKITHQGNMQNMPVKGTTRSGRRGVYRASGRHNRWVAQITVDGKAVHIGRYDSIDEAAEAARLARQRLMPYATD